MILPVTYDKNDSSMTYGCDSSYDCRRCLKHKINITRIDDKLHTKEYLSTVHLL